MTIPRIRFAHLPTAVEPMPRLSAQLSGPKLFVKRDDQTGLGMGGNKARKLEFVLAQAKAENAKTLITVGGIQSNHCRQTAALAARFGLKCILVLSGEEPQIPNGNLLLDTLFGASIVWTSRAKRDETLQHTYEESKRNGEDPFLIPLGASTPIGALGYVEAMRELKEQGNDFNWIVVASSSAGTQAGMVLGASLTKFEGKILGISIDHPVNELQQSVADLANQAAVILGKNTFSGPESVLVNADYLGAGYAIAGKPEFEAIKLFAENEGLLLDPVYTGRAAAGMIDLIRKKIFYPSDKVLFWHTGGATALFANPYTEQLSAR
jgi:D-cysteine desulfhydrase family pyridoxal phosphate-dependent enzyme